MKKIVVFTLFLLLITTGCAFALSIDFRDPAWHGGLGQHTFSIDDITVTAKPGASLLYHDNVDGFGVLGGSQGDEIDFHELLEITFSTDKDLVGFLVTDLFESNDGGGLTGGETGWVKVWQGATFTDFYFYGNSSNQINGEQYISFGGSLTGVNKVEFFAIPLAGNEFSVAGFDEVPEPATLLLFGTGLIGLAGLRRKKKVNG